MRKVAGSRAGDVLRAFRGAFERDGWHGPSLLQVLEGVSGRVAAKRPKGIPHSIQDLVEHVAFCEVEGFVQVFGGRPVKDAAWAPPTRSFPRSVAHLKKAHASLIRAIKGLRETDLDRIVVTGDGPASVGDVLHGIAAHAVYHAGQIALLKKRLL